MKLNEVLGETPANWEFFGEWLYFLCIFGTPSLDEPWAARKLDGHHLNLKLLCPQGPGRNDAGPSGAPNRPLLTAALTPDCGNSTPSSVTIWIADAAPPPALEQEQAIFFKSILFLHAGPAAEARRHPPGWTLAVGVVRRTTSSSRTRAFAPRR